MKDLQVTSGKEWRRTREEGVVLQLPSGNVASIRPAALDVMLLDGKIPDLLTPLAAKTMYHGVDEEELGEALKPEKLLEDGQRWLGLINTVCRAALVSPRVVDEPQADDEIAIEDLDLADRSFVFTLAVQPAEVLRRFRHDEDAGMEPVHDSEEDEPAE